MLEYILQNFLLIYLLELGAALAGSIYLKKTLNPKLVLRWFVGYLWLVIFVELVGLYPAFNYFDNFRTFPFFKDSLFERNFWWYNLYNIVKFSVFYMFFVMQLRNDKLRRILKWITVLVIFSFILNLFISGDFFRNYSAYNNMAGTFFLMVLIFSYFFELLTSEKILEFRKDISFYIAVALLVWHVTVTPLFIYSRFFSLSSPDFVDLHSLILKLSNIFLYGLLITGFFICSRREVPGSTNLDRTAGVV